MVLGRRLEARLRDGNTVTWRVFDENAAEAHDCGEIDVSDLTWLQENRAALFQELVLARLERKVGARFFT